MRIYSANAGSPGLLECFQRAAAEVWQTRGIVWTLARRDVVLQYRQRLLGLAGAFLHPLLALVCFLFLHAAGVLNVGEMAMPYPVFLFAGTFLWGTFVLGLQTATAALVAQGDLLVRTGLPKITVVLAAYAAVAPSLFMQWLVLTGLLAGFQFCPSWFFLLYPLLVLPLFLLGLGLALILAPLAVVIRDLPALMATVLNFLLYLTPVIYHARLDQPWLKALSAWNPLGVLIDGPRALCLTGSLPEASGFVAASGLSLFVLILGIRSFYLVQERIAERL